MPPTEFVDTPRPARTITCDGSLVRPMAAEAWKATFPPANIALRYAVTAVLGVVVWLSTHSAFLTAAIAVLAPTVVLLVSRLRLHQSIRAVVGAGRVLTSGYDAQGRFVVDRATGSLDFAAGAARAVTRVGEVTVVRSRSRQPAFVTASELLTADDADFLTSTSANGDLVEGFRAAHPEVTSPLLVTPAVQQATVRLMRRALVRHPFLQVAVAASVLTVAISDHRLLAAAVVATLGLAVVVILEFGLVRTGTKALFSEGTVVGAALLDDGLVLHVPGYPSHLGTDELRTVRADDDGVVIRTRRQRVHLLPLGTLDADGTARLLGLVAR
ncbi:hypothetical protein ASD62_19130 [Phycicoccus sp. Root563]|uniref:hypothetical protein n=1 Tax=unclassified Phycicoccus TaxID=2637926 RepID=UPI0007033016|nr:MULTISPECIES: hypothetical protein [unclassified Phycicoccus]KQU66504.1 hypothetical protein ASC58_15900 [Phycicoccus sp. Root101]KQZ87655.1 hypothetical protein ASD62_19130 [Phycicoccus sp. Root563]